MANRLIRTSFVAIAAATLLIQAAAFAKDDSAKELAARLNAHYQKVQTLQAVFLERYSEGNGSVRVESGTVFFRRPGQMRWEYEAPEEKLFLSDGKRVWFYVPADRAVTRMPIKESADWRTPLALLTGKANLSRLCSRIDLVEGAPAAPGNQVLRCLPKGEKRDVASTEQGDLSAGEDFTEVLLEIASTTGELSRIQIRQPGGVELEYRFGGWKQNLRLPEELFRFQVPPGVAIVDGGAQAASTSR